MILAFYSSTRPRLSHSSGLRQRLSLSDPGSRLPARHVLSHPTYPPIIRHKSPQKTVPTHSHPDPGRLRPHMNSFSIFSHPAHLSPRFSSISAPSHDFSSSSVNTPRTGRSVRTAVALCVSLSLNPLYSRMCPYDLLQSESLDYDGGGVQTEVGSLHFCFPSLRHLPVTSWASRSAMPSPRQREWKGIGTHLPRMIETYGHEQDPGAVLSGGLSSLVALLMGVNPCQLPCLQGF